MKINSIEPTPSPNTMKLNMDESLPADSRTTWTRHNSSSAPDYIRSLLNIEGVKDIYHAADFIALDRTPKGDWAAILAAAREVFGAESADTPLNAAGEEVPAAYGEVQVLVQVFRGIPMQVRVSSGTEESRAAMPERFTQAVMKATSGSPHLIKERRLEELGVRYGELKDVLGEVVQELDAAYGEERLAALVTQAAEGEGSAEPPQELAVHEAAASMNDKDWRVRYAALQRLTPSLETLPLLGQALQDERASVRRLATVYLGDIKEPDVLPYLYRALKDDSVAVRRTAGDTLSDLGDPAAGEAMAEALSDTSKLVRWRAARFLYEAGDKSALSALRAAEDDPEFEVRMQVKMALERIEGGQEAEGSVWQQMTRRNK